GQAEHAGRGGRGGEVQGRIAVRHVADGRRRVERAAAEDPLHFDERVAFQVLEREGVAQPYQGGDQVGGDRGQPEERRRQPHGARRVPAVPRRAVRPPGRVAGTRL